MDLFNEFAPGNAEQWKALILKDLKLDDLSVLARTRSGLRIKPFYTSEDLHHTAAPVRRKKGCETVALIEVNEAKEANRLALTALEGGATGIRFSIGKKTDTESLIRGISLEHIYSQFDISNDALSVLSDLKEYYLKKNKDSERSTCYVNLDPIHLLQKYGEWHENEEKDLAQLRAFRHLSVDARLYKEAGTNIVTELAITLAHLNEYFERYPDRSHVHVSFAVAGDLFSEIAKLRAFRDLFSLLCKGHSVNAVLHIHAESALLNKSNMDANTNLLRTTTEGMSAILGGADSVGLNEHIAQLYTNKEFANRIARNQLTILKEESFLDKVNDIAAGSYYIESLTEDIGKAAWETFLSTEKNGGLLAGLKNGSIQQIIRKEAAELQESYSSGKRILVGVNKYPNPADKDLPVTKTFSAEGKEIEVLRPLRIAASFEEKQRSSAVK